MTFLRHRSLLPAAHAFIALALLAGCGSSAATPSGLDRIDHIVVIYAENRSFDHLYGLFPGAEGIARRDRRAEDAARPRRHAVAAPAACVRARQTRSRAFPPALPNGPFRIDAPPINGRYDEVLPSPWHLYYQNSEQINGGKNNMFVAMSNVGAWVMGYFDGSSMKLWKWAQEYTLADHFFMGAFGGSLLNHLWLVCACTPQDPRRGRRPRSPQLDEHGNLKKKPDSPALGAARAGGGARRTRHARSATWSTRRSRRFSRAAFRPAAGGNLDLADPSRSPAPPQTAQTIGDTLSAKGVTWAWYAGGWDAALADGRRDPQANARASSTIAAPAARSSSRTTSRSTTSRASRRAARPRPPPEGRAGIRSRRSTRARCRRWRSSSPPAATTSTRATPTSRAATSTSRCCWSGCGRARSGPRWR